MDGCQNYGPFLGPYWNTAPRICGTQNVTIISIITQLYLADQGDIAVSIIKKFVLFRGVSVRPTLKGVWG